MAISNRTPEVTIEYDDLRSGKRVTKHFADSKEGGRFFATKDKAGMNPKVMREKRRSAKHIAVYVRVSSKQQQTRSQEPDLKLWASANADGTSVVCYSDHATGKTMDRPGWNKLEAAMRSGKVTTILVWRLDRLGRTAKGLTALFEELQQRKVNLVSIKDGVDLSTAAGRLIANVLASVAQYENEVRSDRILAGQAAAREKGKKWGGSVKGKRKKVTPEQEETIVLLKGKGMQVTKIARTVKLSRPTIYSVISAADG